MFANLKISLKQYNILIIINFLLNFTKQKKKKLVDYHLWSCCLNIFSYKFKTFACHNHMIKIGLFQ